MGPKLLSGLFFLICHKSGGPGVYVEYHYSVFVSLEVTETMNNEKFFNFELRCNYMVLGNTQKSTNLQNFTIFLK